MLKGIKIRKLIKGAVVAFSAALVFLASPRSLAFEIDSLIPLGGNKAEFTVKSLQLERFDQLISGIQLQKENCEESFSQAILEGDGKYNDNPEMAKQWSKEKKSLMSTKKGIIRNLENAKKNIEKMKKAIFEKYPNLKDKIGYSGLLGERYKLIVSFYLDSVKLSVNEALKKLLIPSKPMAKVDSGLLNSVK